MVQIRRVVAGLVAGGCHVKSAVAVRIDLDAVDQRIGRHALRRDVLPRGTGIAGHVDEAVVRTGPNQPRLARRFSSGKNRRVVFHARVVLGDGSARRNELLGLAAGEVGRDNLPGRATVGGSVQKLRARVEVLGVMRREENGEIPLEAVAHAFSAAAHGVVRPHVDGARHVQVVVEPREKTAVAPSIYDIVVAGIWRQVSALSTGRALPVVVGNEAAAGTGIDADGRVVLLRAVNAVREGIVGGDTVELRRRLVHVRRPGCAGIVADLGATVVGNDQPARIIGRDPQIVVVAVRGIPRLEGASTVRGDVVRHVHDVDAVGVLGIRIDAGVIPSALAQAPVRVEQFPGGAGIVRAVHAAVFVFDDGPNPVGVDRRHGDADDAVRPIGQAFVVHERRPGRTAVLGLPKR